MYTLGNQQLLEDNPIAIYCSREIPSTVYQPALTFVQNLMSYPLTLGGGWQSKVEKEALEAREPDSPSNIIYFLAKGIQNFRLPKFLRSDLDKGKVLIVSLWMIDKRIDQRKVKERDDFIMDQINRFLFLNIKEGGNLEELFFRYLNLEKEVFLLNHPINQKWINPEVVTLSEDDLMMLLS